MYRLILALTALVWASTAAAYDITANIEHADYADATGYRIYYSGVQGGPYANSIQCGKPALKEDGTFDCIGTGLTIKPIYAVAVAYDAQGEGPQSAEYFFARPLYAPNVKNITRK